MSPPSNCRIFVCQKCRVFGCHFERTGTPPLGRPGARAKAAQAAPRAENLLLAPVSPMLELPPSVVQQRNGRQLTCAVAAAVAMSGRGPIERRMPSAAPARRSRPPARSPARCGHLRRPLVARLPERLAEGRPTSPWPKMAHTPANSRRPSTVRCAARQAHHGPRRRRTVVIGVSIAPTSCTSAPAPIGEAFAARHQLVPGSATRVGATPGIVRMSRIALRPVAERRRPNRDATGVKWFNPTKGYGIEPSDGARRVRAHLGRRARRPERAARGPSNTSVGGSSSPSTDRAGRVRRAPARRAARTRSTRTAQYEFRNRRVELGVSQAVRRSRTA